MITVLIAGVLGFVLSFGAIPLFIRQMKKLKLGQLIRDEGPAAHQHKAGTPTMAGLVFIPAAVLAYFITLLLSAWFYGTSPKPSATAWLTLGFTVGMLAVGAADDIMKFRNKGNEGLTEIQKTAGLLAVTLPFSYLAFQFPNSAGATPASTAVSFVRDLPLDLMAPGAIVGTLLVMAWINLIALSGTNAVNFTDGLDGLAGGVMMTIFTGYLAMTVWQYSHRCVSAAGVGCYDVRDAGDLAMIAAAFVGALGGFLLWNVSKAQIFMGDSGSLALGGALVAFAIFTRTELLLPIIALVPVLEVFSVIVQKFVFKFSRKGSVSRGEKVPHAHRFFRMTPFHHHMEKTGVNGMYSIDKKGIAPGTVSSGEVNSVFRLWVVNALCVLIALALFFGDWFSQNTGVIN